MSDDLISKRALLKKTRRMYAPDEIDSMAPVATSCVTVDDIHRAAVVDAVPVVHGRWIHCDGKSIVWYCSECGGQILYNPNPRTYNIKKPKVEQFNKFCRNCGAKMDAR